MAKLLGRLRSVEISTDDGVNYEKIGNLTDSTWNGSRAEINATDADSDDSEEYMAGRMSSTLDISARYNEDDDGQEALIGAFFDADVVKVRWKASNTSKTHTADAFVTSCNIPSPDGDTTNLTATLRITGAVSRS
jgi:hypothetical protein